MWLILIDDPYANGKASVISAVGTANRCRVVHSSALGLVTVLGYDHDLAAVELLGFADRIGQRLREATDAQVSATAGGAGQLVPVLAARDEQLDAAERAAFPHLERRRSSLSNASGWTAGQVAADQANVDASPHRLPEA